MDSLAVRTASTAQQSSPVSTEPDNYPSHAGTNPKTTPKTTPKRPHLRTLPISDRQFWKTDPSEQSKQVVLDNRGMGKTRKLPGNEITALALNEIAASKGRGFFFHLLTREAWTSWSGEEFHPRSRIPETPGSQVPSLLYMNYVWSDHTRQNFLAETHRGRYLKCDFMINPPRPGVPLYAIQYLTASNQATWLTPVDSLVLFAIEDYFYLAKTTELERVGGAWPSEKRAPRGPDPKQRLNTAPYLWDSAKDAEKARAMQQYRMPDLEAVYDNIVSLAIPPILASTYSVSDLRDLIPRPLAPELGVGLGSQNDGFKSAYAKPRRECRLSTKKPRLETEADVGDDDYEMDNSIE